MKTKLSLISRMVTMAMALVLTTTLAFADGETTDFYTSGTTSTSAGDFVVHSTSDVFHFQGEKFDVYKVYYDNPEMNMRIAVNTEGKCKSFIAYTKDYTIFYKCTRDGFGVRKVMFSNPEVHKSFSHEAFQGQTVLRKNRKIERKDAIAMVATYLPCMQCN